MDAYLTIAEAALEEARRPLSPKAILEIAYKRSLVPPHLFGKTQHKTLQARISEDIVERREHSVFFRTEPGRFFLRRYLADTTIPEEFRVEFPTRRRIRELSRGPALAFEYTRLEQVARQDAPISPSKILSQFEADNFCYDDPKVRRDNLVFVRTFVCVHRERSILSYRVGRYRDDRDAFMSKRSIGFSAFVNADDCTLFNLGTLGIIEAGVSATKIDLDIPQTSSYQQSEARLSYFMWSTWGSKRTDLLAVINLQCPDWFEPLKRRLAIHDLCWLDASIPVNDINDFDPWSKAVLLNHYRSKPGGEFDLEIDNSPIGSGSGGLSQVTT